MIFSMDPDQDPDLNLAHTTLNSCFTPPPSPHLSSFIPQLFSLIPHPSSFIPQHCSLTFSSLIPPPSPHSPLPRYPSFKRWRTSRWRALKKVACAQHCMYNVYIYRWREKIRGTRKRPKARKEERFFLCLKLYSPYLVWKLVQFNVMNLTEQTLV